MTKAKRNTKAATATNQFDMTSQVSIEHMPENALPGSELEAIFAELGGDDIIEIPDVAKKHPTELELLAAVGDATHEEALKEVYAEQSDGLEEVAAADLPAAESTEVEAKPKKEKAAKAPKEPRLTYVISKKSEIVTARTAGYELVLEGADAALSEEDRAAKMKEFIASIDAMPKKVGEKAVQFLSDIQKYTGAGDIKNEVIRRAVQLLIKDGELTSGDKGNLQTDLLAKPYSIGTARSQSAQMFALLPALKMTVRDKGRMVANPDSILLMMLKAA